MGRDMGLGSKPATAPQRRHTGQLQNIESATSGEHIEQDDVAGDESDSPRYGTFIERSRTGGSGNSLLN